MFKYPDNIIVNWLRSKMQGKIDSLQEQVDELEKNYFDTSNYLWKSAGAITVNNIDKTTVNATTTGTYSAISYKIGNLSDFLGKKLIFYCDYQTDNDIQFNNFGFISCKADGSDRVQLSSGAIQHNVTTSGNQLFCGVKIEDNTQGELLAVRLYVSGGTVPNEITFSNIRVKILEN